MRLFAAAVFLLPVISRASEVSDDRVRYALRVIDAGRLAITPRPPRPKPGEVELGRRLFFDPRLSRSGVMSCSSCHNPARAWTDGLPRAMGNAGEAVKRRTPSLLNLYLYADKFFWDGRAASVEQAALTALRNPLEMNGDSAFVLARLASIPGYARRFEETYGDEGVTERSVGAALASFLGTIRPAGPSAFERARTEPSALNQAQRRGLELFIGKGDCYLCHSGPALTDNFYHNVGLPPLKGVQDDGRYPYGAVALARRAFRTPSLWDAAARPPYMHDGSLATLEAVIEHYDRGGYYPKGRHVDDIKPLGLTRAEKRDLVAFLGALTRPRAPVVPPKLPPDGGAFKAPPPAEQVDRYPIDSVAEAPPSVEASTGAAEIPIADARRLAKCRADSSADELIASLSAAAPAAEARRAFYLIDDHAENYFAAEAFRAGGPAPCARLAAFGEGAQSPRHQCEERYQGLSFARAMFLGGDSFTSACLGFVQGHNAPFAGFDAGQAADACERLRLNRQDPKAICAALQPDFLRADLVPACEIEFGRYDLENTEGCDHIYAAAINLVQRCEGPWSFRKARRSGRIEDCGRSQFCRVLMGGGDEAERAEAGKIKEILCAP